MKNISVTDEIKLRYSKESGQDCNLSCGSNLAALNICEGEYILDLGCGRGKDTIEAARITGNMGGAVGLDITREMIETARKNVPTGEKLNVSFVVGDIESLPFKNETFNIVTSNCVINHARDKLKAYSEINRVLKHGGRFVVSDAVTKKPLPPEVKNDAKSWAECFGGAITEKAYLKSIKNAGFVKIEILNRREYIKNGYEFISLTIKAFK